MEELGHRDFVFGRRNIEQLQTTKFVCRLKEERLFEESFEMREYLKTDDTI